MAAPQRRRPPRRKGRANSDAERRALAKANAVSTRPVPRTRPGFAVAWADGGARGNPGAAAIGYVITGPGGETLAAHAEPIGIAGANVAEYRALLAALRHAHLLGLDRLDARCDSRLVIEHVVNGPRPANPKLAALRDDVIDAAQQVGTVTFTWVPAAANGAAHALVAEALAP
jgi:ribonuclease HI